MSARCRRRRPPGAPPQRRLALGLGTPAARAAPPEGAEGVDGIDRTARRRLGAWVIAGTTGAASALFLRAALDHWQSARLLDARSHDPSREFGDRRSLHQQAVEEWEFGNRSRNLAAASGLAALASSALLLHLYGDRSEASRMKLRCATPAAGGLAVGWTFSF